MDVGGVRFAPEQLADNGKAAGGGEALGGAGELAANDDAGVFGGQLCEFCLERRRYFQVVAEQSLQVAEVDDALKGFDHAAMHRGDFPWDLRNASAVIDLHLDQVENSRMRLQIDAVRANLAEYVEPRMPLLEQSVIHNDANDHNVIVQCPVIDRQQVAGLIDFGDMVYSYTICGLAIAVAYAMLDKTDPLLAATHIVEGYHGVRPLTEDELAVVFPMACGRLAVSACMAAVQQRQRPDDPYLSVSQQPIQRTLQRLLEIHPRFAEATFRQASGEHIVRT